VVGVTVLLEEDALVDWLIAYLEADTMLMSLIAPDHVMVGVYEKTEAAPYIRIDHLDGEDLMVIGLHRVWVDATYHIRGVSHWRGTGQPDRTEVNTIGARLDALLHDQESVTATHSIHSFREEPEPLPTIYEAGSTNPVWLQSGGIYRIRAAAI
jgi:hypothetical protein